MSATVDATTKSVNSVIDTNDMDFGNTKDTKKIIATNAVACYNTARKFPAARLAALKHVHQANASLAISVLSLVLCALSFASVFSLLFFIMDTTQIEHQQFRLNMSRDEPYGIQQDDPKLIKFIREYHLRKNHMNFMKNTPMSHSNAIERHELVPTIAKTIVNLLDARPNGVFFQSLTSDSSSLLTAPWLAEHFGWGGFIVEPESTRYFSLCKENSQHSKVQIIQACLSTNDHPKEITLHHGNDESEVRINSLFDEETIVINTRVKCYPLYTLMLAVNETNIDLLSLGCQGQELEILQTVPFQKVNIKIISIHLDDYYSNTDIMVLDDDYQKKITKFLESKSYRLIKKLGHNYIYQSLKSIYKKSRTTTSTTVTPSSPPAPSSTTTTTTTTTTVSSTQKPEKPTFQ